MSDERRDHQLLWIQCAGAAGATTATLTVPAGHTYRVVGAWGGKDQAAALNTQWLLNDSTANHECSTVKSLNAVAERFSLYENGNVGEAMILHQNYVLSFVVTGIGGGNIAFFHALVEVRQGETAAY